MTVFRSLRGRAKWERDNTQIIKPYLGDVVGDPGGWRPELDEYDRESEYWMIDLCKTLFFFICLAAAGIILVLIAAMIWVGVIVVDAGMHAAYAHDSWISRGGYRNQQGEWCCGEHDCAVIPATRIRFAPDGYHILGALGAEVIPYSEAQPSPDGAYWRCRRPDGSRRCFFAPPPTN